MLPPIEFTLGERVKLNATGVEFTPMVNATLFIRGGIYFGISGSILKVVDANKMDCNLNSILL